MGLVLNRGATLGITPGTYLPSTRTNNGGWYGGGGNPIASSLAQPGNAASGNTGLRGWYGQGNALPGVQSGQPLSGWYGGGYPVVGGPSNSVGQVNSATRPTGGPGGNGWYGAGAAGPGAPAGTGPGVGGAGYGNGIVGVDLGLGFTSGNYPSGNPYPGGNIPNTGYNSATEYGLLDPTNYQNAWANPLVNGVFGSNAGPANYPGRGLGQGSEYANTQYTGPGYQGASLGAGAFQRQQLAIQQQQLGGYQQVRRSPQFAPGQGRSPADVASGKYGTSSGGPALPGLADEQQKAANVARGLTPDGKQITPVEFADPRAGRQTSLQYIPTSESDTSRGGLDPNYLRFLESVWRTNRLTG